MFKDNRNSAIPSLVAVEDYPYASTDDAKLATARLAELASLASHPATPPSLRILHSLAFIKDEGSLKLIYSLPPNTSNTNPPVTLHALLSQTHNIKSFRLPSLDARLLLAQQIASAVYSFILVRWFHKDLTPKNIIFFRSKSTNDVMLSSPYIVGFSISRPDFPGERSFNNFQDSEDIYLHPCLRVEKPEDRPRYHRRFEIWSLAILLLEIALWRPLEGILKINKVKMEKTEAAKAIMDRARKDLPFYVGERYRRVVERCLEIGNGAEVDGEEMNAIYWDVVLELAKCR
ncbi:hypothetical protein ABW19_dt0202279 [Dactylella cylindrospora]|nr:hypothetical protein ABW19_dt0202279 [Dactylella cylindrospora]